MKIFALLLLGLVLALQYRLWIADGGMREVSRLRQEVATQTDENGKLKERNRILAAEVQDLKKGKSAVEERARADLGMVGDNETFFQVADRVAATSTGSHAPTPTDNQNAPPPRLDQASDRTHDQAQDQTRDQIKAAQSPKGATRLAVQANK